MTKYNRTVLGKE